MKISAVPFGALDRLTAYSLWKLRQDVFVVEQQAAYADLDGRDLDPDTRHVVLEDEQGVVVQAVQPYEPGFDEVFMTIIGAGRAADRAAATVGSEGR